jgi:energy-coupling factor transport system ATP-binding protein
VDTSVRNLAMLVGQVFEDPETQLLATSVENEVAFPLENLGYSAEEIRERVTWALLTTGLTGLEKKHPQDLSGGQKQRLAIASAIATRPQVLVLDEPTSQLDGAGAEDVLSALDRLNHSSSMTILMVSHHAEEIVNHATRLILLMDGRVAFDSTPREVYGETDAIRRAGLRGPDVLDICGRVAGPDFAGDSLPITIEEGITFFEGMADRISSEPQPIFPGVSRHGEPILRVEGVQFEFPDGTKALTGIDLQVFPGEYILLAGQNGAGKTTLVKAVLNLLKPQQGHIFVHGVDSSKMPVSVLARTIGYVGQNPDTQIFTSSVWEEVTFALRFQGIPEAELVERAKNSLVSVGLWRHKDRHPYALPKGDRARVVIAAVLALQPEVLIFDEPTVGQDFIGARGILEITKQLQLRGKTVVVITHHLYLMPEYAERVVVLDQGQVVSDAPLREAFYAIQKLRNHTLEPPPTVFLAQAISRLTGTDAWQVTPEELIHSTSIQGFRDGKM